MSHLIACHGRDEIGTVLVQEGRHYFIVETVTTDGDCIAYRTFDNLQEAWYEYDIQKVMEA